MKKILVIIIALSFCLSGCNNKSENTNMANTNIENSTNSINVLDDDNTNIESEISSFSTKIYTPNDTARQNNIQITCSKLNETIVASRRNFFFL